MTKTAKTKTAKTKTANEAAPTRQGRDYIARVGLTNKAGETLATPGGTCDQVPATSLPWLIEQGLIVPVAPAEAQE